jgi:hypothetical protein
VEYIKIMESGSKSFEIIGEVEGATSQIEGRIKEKTTREGEE